VSILRRIAQAQDPVVRDPENVLDYLKVNIPGLSQQVPARLNRFGEDVKRNVPHPLLNVLLPRAVSPVKQDPVAVALEDAGASLGMPSGRFTAGGKALDLSPAEERALQKSRGQLNKEVLSRLIANPVYKALPPEARKQVIERLKNRIERDRRVPELLEILKQRRQAQPQ
jgi:hypothetical protein